MFQINMWINLWQFYFFLIHEVLHLLCGAFSVFYIFMPFSPSLQLWLSVLCIVCERKPSLPPQLYLSVCTLFLSLVVCNSGLLLVQPFSVIFYFTRFLSILTEWEWDKSKWQNIWRGMYDFFFSFYAHAFILCCSLPLGLLPLWLFFSEPFDFFHS